MKKISHFLLSGIFGLLVCACTSVAPVGNVEGLERQAPVSPDPNAIGDALNARNAVDYANGNTYNHRGYRY